MKKKNLVVLLYSGLGSTAKVVPLDEMDRGQGKLSVDLENGTWDYEHMGPFMIGSRGNFGINVSNIRGVYDLNDIRQINQMVEGAVNEAVSCYQKEIIKDMGTRPSPPDID